MVRREALRLGLGRRPCVEWYDYQRTVMMSSWSIIHRVLNRSNKMLPPTPYVTVDGRRGKLNQKCVMKRVYK